MEKDKDKTVAKFSKQQVIENDIKLTPPDVRLEYCFDAGKTFPFELNNSILR